MWEPAFWKVPVAGLNSSDWVPKAPTRSTLPFGSSKAAPSTWSESAVPAATIEPSAGGFWGTKETPDRFVLLSDTVLVNVAPGSAGWNVTPPDETVGTVTV